MIFFLLDMDLLTLKLNQGYCELSFTTIRVKRLAYVSCGLSAAPPTDGTGTDRVKRRHRPSESRYGPTGVDMD